MIKFKANSAADAAKIVKYDYPDMLLYVKGNLEYYAVTQAEWNVLYPADTTRRLDYDDFKDRWPTNNKWWDTWEFARTNAVAFKFMMKLAIEDKGLVLNSTRTTDFLQLLVDNNVLTNSQRNGILAP